MESPARCGGAVLRLGRTLPKVADARGDGDFHRFLNMAAGSSFELEYFLLLSRDLGLLPSRTHLELTTDAREVQKMLGSLLRKVEASRRRIEPTVTRR